MENKEVKMSLSTFFLIIAIIVIIIMGYFMYRLSNEKNEISIKANDLYAKVETLENKIDNIEDAKQTENVKLENVQTENTTGSTASEKDETSNKLSQNEALKLLKEKFGYIETMWLSPAKIFDTKTIDSEGRYEIIDYQKTILKYGTENLFNEYEKNRPGVVIYENGIYYIVDGGGDRPYDGLDGFENIKVTENAITATLKTKQNEYNEEKHEWFKGNDKTSEFKLVKQGEQWLVDEFNSSDLD